MSRYVLHITTVTALQGFWENVPGEVVAGIEKSGTIRVCG